MEAIKRFLGISSGYGDGSGDGSGYGSGSGDGYGYGYGEGYGIKTINENTVHTIDNVPTLIDHVHGNIAKGRILSSDLTLNTCYVV